jgi:hypothetical protein
VESRSQYEGPTLESLFGRLRDSFAGKTEHLERLITECDEIDLKVSYSKGPVRSFYRLHRLRILHQLQPPA